MKTILTRLGFILLISAFILQVACAEDAPKTLDFGGAVVNRYIWRGLDLLEHAPAFQPYVTWYAGNTGFSANVWYSWALTKRDEAVIRRNDEIDLSASYVKTFGAVQTTLGMIYVNYYVQKAVPTNVNTAYEGIFGAALPNVPLAPSLIWNHSFNPDAKGEYVTLGLTYAQPVGGLPTPLVFNEMTGYSTQGWFVDDNGNQKRGISDANLAVSEDVPWGSVTVTPSVAVNYTPNKNSRHDQTAFVGSLTVKQSW